MGVVIEGLEDHEGYADQRLADGRLTGGRWQERCSGFVPACGCGWHASQDYPPTEAGEQAALDDWHDAHATPLLQRHAQQRRAELAQALRALGGIADFLDNPANLARIGRATDRVRELVEELQRDLDRRARAREADGER
jgi:hypothetical protein